MNRTVYFHTIDSEKLPLFKNGICYINNALNSLKENELIQFKNSKAVIEINAINHNYCFGSIGKLEDFEDKPLTRSRLKGDIDNKEDIKNMENYIESFTYFCVDLSTFNCAVLRNSDVPSFRKYFKSLLIDNLELLNKYKHIEIVDKLSENINEEIDNMSPITSFTYVHDANNLPSNNHLTLGETHLIDNDLIRKSRVSIYLDNTKNTSKIKDMFSGFMKYKENYSEFTIESDDQTIDVIKNILTKKVSIPISNDTLKNQELIFNKLKDLLLTN